ncbi:RNA-directed DNA polymerase [Clavibacter michiganensis]|nr:RNA-directed DNA polymerase [Clavibacter michiganensis]
MRRTSIPAGVERGLMSDVAPFELPPNVSNVGFYAIATLHNLRWDKTLSWKARNAFVDHFAVLLANRTATNNIFIDPTGRANLKTGKTWRIPLRFPIRKAGGDRRNLSFPHALNQIQMISFYETYASSLLFACSRSSFSLRRPEKVSRFTFTDDPTHRRTRSRRPKGIESVYREHETFTSYFRYGRYTNINKFYESAEFHRLEARFSYQRRLDITRCFESLYTHSLDWAVRGHHASKQGIGDDVFSARLDGLFQSCNHGQTNGLIIGPEFSRIGAEIVLQDVDLAVEKTLLERKPPLRHDREYWIGRYVDDYFVFCEDANTAQIIQHAIEDELEKYNLRFNRAKETNYVGPSSSPIHDSKHAMAGHVSSFFKEAMTSADVKSPRSRRSSVDALISNYKSLLVDESVVPTNLNNYVLGVVEKRVRRLLRQHRPETRAAQDDLTDVLRQTCTFVEFLHFTSPSVSSSVRATRIMHMVVELVSEPWMQKDLRAIVLDDIDRACRSVVDRNQDPGSAFFGTEASFWLLLHSKLGRVYLLEPDRLEAYYWRSLSSGSKYLTIVTVMLYMESRTRYNGLRDLIVSSIPDSIAHTHPDSAEMMMLKSDLLACPYITKAVKTAWLTSWFPTSTPTAVQDAISGWPSAIFAEWEDFDLGDALRSKQGRHVY